MITCLILTDKIAQACTTRQAKFVPFVPPPRRLLVLLHVTLVTEVWLTRWGCSSRTAIGLCDHLHSRCDLLNTFPCQPLPIFWHIVIIFAKPSLLFLVSAVIKHPIWSPVTVFIPTATIKANLSLQALLEVAAVGRDA